MDSKEKTLKHFNETAADYNDSSDGKFVHAMYQALVEEINHVGGGKLLDIGCGNGNLFGLVTNENLSFYGIDLSEKMIEQAKASFSEVAKLYVSDAEKLPFKNEVFDILVCNASFHHYTHPDTVLEEMKRVAAPGCILLIGDPYAPQPFRGLANIFTKYSDEGDFHYYGIHEMQRLLYKHGFDYIRSRRTGDHSILHIAKKPI